MMGRVDHMLDRCMTFAVLCVPLYMVYKIGLFMID